MPTSRDELNLRFRLREHLRTALWPIPCALGVAGLVLGMLVWRFDRWAGWALLDFEDRGGTALAAAIVGATLTFLEMPTWEDYVSLAVDEIRHFGEQQLQIVRRLRALLEDLRQTVPAERRGVIERELALLTETVLRGFADAEDQARAREPDSQGLGSSPKLGP